ncbi:MAG: dihydroorotase [Lachnospiraceae bacterium]|nr:dihydroorotase [Lachnospiraceae bacterium]
MLIENVHLLDPGSGFDGICDIETEGEKIKSIRERSGEGSGITAVPGFVDGHVHFRDPGFPSKEDIITGAAAAAAGGYTSVICMANTKPPIDNTDTLRYVLEKGKTTPIHVYSAANVTVGMKGQQVTDMKALAKAGAVCFTDDGIPIRNESVLREAMKMAAELDMPILLHEEDPRYVRRPGFDVTAPREAEISLVSRDIGLAGETKARILIQHVSCKESVKLIREGLDEGIRVAAELTPHHMALTSDAVKKYGTLAKVNPPLRSEADRQALMSGAADGTLAMIATDHAPHTESEKSLPNDKAPSGMIGLETAFSIGLRELVGNGKVSLMKLIEMMTITPARFYGLDAGYIAEGGPADITLIDLRRRRKVTTFHSRSYNSPFKGESLPGTILKTICMGNVAYDIERDS